MDAWSELEKELRQCSLPELEKLATGLSADDSSWKDETAEAKRKKKLVRTIEDMIDEVDERERGEHIKSLILPHLPDRAAENLLAGIFKEDKPPGISMKTTDADSSFGGAVGMDGDRLSNLMDTMALLKTLGLDSSTSSFRREYKISGTIGSAQKDHLNYISLCGQIAEGKKRGYPDAEIAAAIRKAVQPGSNLRTYLDSKIDLPLDQVISFIRSYLKEKSSTELFQDLNNLVQSDTDDAQAFILRAMELREKVLMASEAEGSIRYDADLVQSLFLHTIRTGLVDDSVKARIEPLVRKGADTPDDVLIQEVNIAASEEAERKQKRCHLGGARRKVGTSEVNTRPEPPICDQRSAIQEAMAPILSEFKTMTEEIKTLKQEVNQLKSKKNFRGGCDHCKKNDKAESCRHCWRCGAGDHMSRQCPKNKTKSSN